MDLSMMDTLGTISWVVLILTACSAVWAMTASSSLLIRFREKHPRLAEDHVPYAFDSWAHPEKAVFCFRKLFRGVFISDPELRRLRRRYAASIVVTISLPLVWMVVLLFFMLSES